MALLDIFKKDKKEEKRVVPKKPQVKVVPKAKVQKPSIEKPKIEKPKTARKIVKKEFSQAYRIIKRPIVTEKSTNMEAMNRYVFEVFDSANKPEIKKAVQDLYGVEVVKVNIVKVRGKIRRLGQHEGWHAGYKKALVTLSQGHSIEIIAR
jgi:large subunit ribosomal protein L23